MNIVYDTHYCIFCVVYSQTIIQQLIYYTKKAYYCVLGNKVYLHTKNIMLNKTMLKVKVSI